LPVSKETPLNTIYRSGILPIFIGSSGVLLLVLPGFVAYIISNLPPAASGEFVLETNF